jgi:ABC-type branched-subunit amino acid transport system ATPase component/ABC-type branched-subunit amino acid transport system permease subunit
MAFAGIGALGTAAFVRSTTVSFGNINVRFGPTSLVTAIAVMTVVCAAIAAIVGIGALRVRGLLLGVSTFVFAYAAQGHLFHLEIFTGGKQPPVRLPRGTLGNVDLSEQRAYYWFVLVIVAIMMATFARLRRRAPWRRMVAVRDNANTAAAYTVAATREKLLSFALAGAVAGLAGGLLGALSQNINTNQTFVVGDSLRVVSIAVIGGLGSVSGPLLGALWVEGLPALFPETNWCRCSPPVSSPGALLLYFPGGLVQIRVLGAGARCSPGSPPRHSTAGGATADHLGAPRAATRRRRHAAIEVRDIVVSFGGLRAVNRASLTVRCGEVVGLIGPNGAGKSTLFNAIGGFVPSAGHIEVLGHDVAKLPAHRRAALGLGRTFQSAALFPEMSVRQTVMVALEARHRAGLLAHIVAWPTAGRDEARKTREADEIIHFLGLGGYADVNIGELSTGTRRIVELAGLLAVNAQVMCLDEPTAGVAQRETEAFGPLLLAIRRELDASILVIEHDMPLIMSMSDRVYCLETGRVIAEGTPAEVRSNPMVIASYLGTDERAIDRSDARSTKES